MTTGAPLAPRAAYNLAAAQYEAWPWQEFWHANEQPVVMKYLDLGPSGPVLDLGAGTGFYLRELALKGAEAVGLDVSEEMLRRASQLSARPLLVQGDARRLPFASGTFARALIARVLSQIDDVDVVFAEAGRVLQPAGALVLSDLDPRHSYTNTELPCEGGKIAVQTYKRTLDEIAGAAGAHGFAMSDSVTLSSGHVAMPVSIALPSLDPKADRAIAFIARFEKRA